MNLFTASRLGELCITDFTLPCTDTGLMASWEELSNVVAFSYVLFLSFDLQNLRNDTYFLCLLMDVNSGAPLSPSYLAVDATSCELELKYYQKSY